MPFSFGSAYSRFFRLISDNFALFLILGLILTVLPTLAINYGLYAGLEVQPGSWWEKWDRVSGSPQIWLVGSGLVSLLLYMINLSAITEIAILRAVGKSVSLPTVLGHAAFNALPLVLILLMTGVVAGFAFLLLVFPCFMFLMAAYVAIPAYVSEQGLGLWGSVKRSFVLTRGHRWTLFGLTLVNGIASNLFDKLLEVLGANLGSALPMPGGLTDTLITSLGDSLSSLTGMIFTAAVYVGLRISRDKMRPDDAAQVFD
ncbi:hypothetical protein AEAC466_04965 [Asticcacaulis sp. AC466]|uniref:hypothetical protein n=1 Tax=Asticcacaulis sp. AC466 TaxID=1282362 RepID=UPI0003C410A9|nr:hypothetical protein [Asticcacaulis sp. AC466]ESQ85061.1 hypothetical protein AEAC466_04965 [Asticcacaulis sp. AC466]